MNRRDAADAANFLRSVAFEKDHAAATASQKAAEHMAKQALCLRAIADVIEDEAEGAAGDLVAAMRERMEQP